MPAATRPDTPTPTPADEPRITFQRLVVYEVTAPSLEDAIDIWADAGPQVNPGVRVISGSDFEPLDS